MQFNKYFYAYGSSLGHAYGSYSTPLIVSEDAELEGM